VGVERSAKGPRTILYTSGRLFITDSGRPEAVGPVASDPPPILHALPTSSVDDRNAARSEFDADLLGNVFRVQERLPVVQRRMDPYSLEAGGDMGEDVRRSDRMDDVPDVTARRDVESRHAVEVVDAVCRRDEVQMGTSWGFVKPVVGTSPIATIDS
jgi:hypothetical protein